MFRAADGAKMMACPHSAAHAALVGVQRRCDWSRSGPPIASLGLIGAHGHHHLDHLVHLVVLVAQVEDDALNDREALTEDDRWLLPPSCFFQLHLFVAFDAPSSRHVVRRCG